MEEQILDWFSSSGKTLCELSQLKDWIERQESGQSFQLLKDATVRLVDSGRLNCKVLNVEGESYSLYWLSRKPQGPNLSSTSGSGQLSKRRLSQFVPPLLSAKKHCMDHDNSSPGSSRLECDCVGVASDSSTTSKSGLIGEGAETVLLENDYVQLTKTLEERKEKLRKLKLVQLYRSKNNLSKLDELVEKWRLVSQEVVENLISMSPYPKPSVTQLLAYLHIDPKVIRYSEEDEAFY